MPAVGVEALGHVVVVGQLGRTVDGDVVVVVDVDEPPQPQMAGERCRLVADPLHQVAVAAEDEGVVVDELGAEAGPQPALGDAHAHAVAEPLAQRAGGDLDPVGEVHLGMTRRLAGPLTELLDVVEGESVAGEEEKGVQKDRGVAVGQDEAVTVGPVGVGRVVAHDPGEQHVCEGRQRHGRARVARIGLLRGVHGQAPDHVDPELLELRFGHGENRTRSVAGPNGAFRQARKRVRSRARDGALTLPPSRRRGSPSGPGARPPTP